MLRHFSTPAAKGLKSRFPRQTQDLTRSPETIRGDARPPRIFDEMIEKAPVFIDRRSGAALISANLFPISHRSLEALVTTLRNFLTAMLGPVIN